MRKGEELRSIMGQLAEGEYTPEQALGGRVLERAVDAIRKRREEGKEAETWIWSDEEDPFSFIWYCDKLNINPSYFRRLVREIIKERKREEARRLRAIRRLASSFKKSLKKSGKG